MKVTVYTICWNEIFLLPHFFKHYDWADKIIVYDNDSTDGSQEFVRNHPKGELRFYNSDGKQNNWSMRDVKNNCWKGDDSDFVVVCDMDEFLIGYENLEKYKGKLVVFDCKNWEAVTEEVPTDFEKVDLFFHHSKWHQKALCFNPRIEEIKYSIGCHWCDPKPSNRKNRVLAYRHYVSLSEDYMVERWQRYAHRLSGADRKMGVASHNLMSEEEIRAEFRLRLAYAKGEIK